MFVLLILNAEVLEERYTTSAAEYCPPTSNSYRERGGGDERVRECENVCERQSDSMKDKGQKDRMKDQENG
jgi:hypothetical protein